MRRLLILLLFLPATAAKAQTWDLVWSDEFDGTEVDATRWGFETGDGCPDLCGWGNGEEQYYQAENAVVEGGLLKIVAREESIGSSAFTSARLRTKGLAAWTYGRIETRAKMPSGTGFWPAVWLLPEDNEYGAWAASGEIDLLEVFGTDQATVHGTLHFGGESPRNTFEGGSFTLPSGSFSDDFHEFAIEWVPGEVRWYVDGQLYHTQNSWYSSAGRFPAPFNKPFHLLINLALGAAGGQTDSALFPQALEVDYIRVYQTQNTPPTVSMNRALNGFRASVGSNINLSATASDTDGTISRLELYSSDVLIGTLTAPPFSQVVGPIAEGCYTIRARAVDNLGGESWSDPVSFSAGSCAQAPVSLIAPRLPGLIQAEAFDLGGEGIAYHDLDAVNNGNPEGGGMRSEEGVDLEYAFGNRQGFYVSDFQAGEWVEYTVEVPLGRGYDLELRAHSEAGAVVSIHADGAVVVPALEVAASEPGPFPTTFARDFPLATGRQVIRIQVEQGSLSMDAFTLKPNPDAAVAGTFALLDFQSAALADLGFFGSVAASIESDGSNRFLRAVYSGAGGTGSTFYGVAWRNYDDDAQVVIPADPWFSARVRHRATTNVVRYAFEVTLREDTNGDGWDDGDEDSHRLDTMFEGAAFNDEWITISAPLSSFTDLHTGGNGLLESAIDEVVFVVSQVEGPNPSSVAIDIDDVYLSTGPIDTGIASNGLPEGFRLRQPYPNPASSQVTVEYDLDAPSHIRLAVFDLLGREVLSVLDEARPAGTQLTALDASGLSAGVYFVRLASGRASKVVPLLVAR